MPYMGAAYKHACEASVAPAAQGGSCDICNSEQEQCMGDQAAARLHTCMAVCAMRRHMSLAVLTRSIMKSIIECVAGAPAVMPPARISGTGNLGDAGSVLLQCIAHPTG